MKITMCCKSDDTNTVYTSSGELLTFCRYFFTTSSGVLPADRTERKQKKREETMKGKKKSRVVNCKANTDPLYDHDILPCWGICSSCAQKSPSLRDSIFRIVSDILGHLIQRWLYLWYWERGLVSTLPRLITLLASRLI